VSRGAAVLALNAGSSSLKFALYDPGGAGSLTPRAAGEIAPLGAGARLSASEAEGSGRHDVAAPEGTDAAGAVAVAARWLGARGLFEPIGAVGHRIVHGGAELAEPCRIDAAIVERLEQLVPLAPLHQPPCLAAIAAARDAFAGAAHVACFDTAFHRTMPPVAQAEALPRRYAEAGVRRYGFHGLSYEHVAAALPRLDPVLAGARVIAAHLGNGASLCAMRAGRSVATTMGMTPLDGLVMGTRAGSLDPGAVLYLIDRHGLDARALERLLYRESGLLGVSGISSDMRVLLASGDPRAREAVDLFAYRAAREIGSLAAALGGADALVFTGGIGEHSAEIRARICRDAAWLGVAPPDESAAAGPARRLSRPGARVAVWVVASDENGVIARHTAEVLRLDSRRGLTPS
jgi:acetate kinase